MKKKIFVYIMLILMVAGQIGLIEEPVAGQQSAVVPDPITLNGNYITANRTVQATDIELNEEYATLSNNVNNPFFGYSDMVRIYRNFNSLEALKVYSSTIFYLREEEFISQHVSMYNHVDFYPVSGTDFFFEFDFTIEYISHNDTHINAEFKIYAWHGGFMSTTYYQGICTFIRNKEYLLVELNYEASTYYTTQNRVEFMFSVIQTTESNDPLYTFQYRLNIPLGQYRYSFKKLLWGSNNPAPNTFYSRIKYNELYYSNEYLTDPRHQSFTFYFKNRLMSRIRFEPEPSFHEITELPYWIYSTTELSSYHELINHSSEYIYSVIINESYIENRTREVELAFNYSKTQVIWIEGKYYYNPETIKPEDWGNWGINNWMRNLLVKLINALILGLNFLFYLILVALNYLIWVPISYLVLIVNNYVFFYLTWGLSWIIFASILVFLWLWDKVIFPALQALWYYVVIPAWRWLVDNVFVPAWEWVKDFFRRAVAFFQADGLKYLINLFLTITAFVLAVILWVISFGRLDFMSLWSAISNLLIAINTFIYDTLNMFLMNILLFLGYSLTYLIMVGLIYVKYIYCKAKGYVVRAQRLQSMINVYKLPLVLTVRVFQYVIGFLQGGSPTDGADK